MTKQQKIDLALHALGSIALTSALIFIFGTFIGVFLNILFWFGREIYQDYNKGHKWPYIWPIRRSTQKDLEFSVPTIISILLGIIF